MSEEEEGRRRRRRLWLPYPQPEQAPDNPTAPGAMAVVDKGYRILFGKDQTPLDPDLEDLAEQAKQQNIVQQLYQMQMERNRSRGPFGLDSRWRSPQWPRFAAFDREINELVKPRRFVAFDRAIDDMLFPALRVTRDRVACDFKSARTYSQDGHLHVANNIISRAQVSPYYGEEIPDSEALGLDPAKKYWLLRDPNELAKAAPSFGGKPILADHMPISADDHPHDMVIGSIGNDTHFDPPFLRGTLNFWDGDAIKEINSGKRRALSCGYHYTPVMRPGVYEGKKYDGLMTDIHGQHLALVEEGRVGPMAVVADAMPPGLRV